MAVDRLGQQDIVSDAKAIFSLLSQDLRANTGTGSQHEPVTLSASVSNLFDITTGQELQTDASLARGDLFTVNASTEMGRLAHPGGAGYALTTNGTDVLWDQTPAWTGLHNFNAGLTILDNQPLNIGTDLDTIIVYDEAGDDRTEVTGADWLFDSLIVNIGTAAGGGGERLAVREDQDAVTAGEIVNASALTAAAAFMRMKNTPGASGAAGAHELGVGVLGTGFTTAGIAFQDSAMIQAGGSLSGGMTIRTLGATPIVCGVNTNDEVWRVDANGFTIPDDVFFNLGTGQDVSFEYDAGNAHLQITGAPIHIAQNVGIGAEPDAALSVKTGGQNAVVNIYDAAGVRDYGVIQVSSSGSLANPANRPLAIQPNDGDVGIGTIAPDASLSVKTSGQDAVVNIYNVSAAVDYGAIQVSNSGGLTNPSDRPLALQPNGGDVGIGIIAPDGTLHVHTASAGVVTAWAGASDLVVENLGGGISILTADNGSGSLIFGSPGNQVGAEISWNFDNSIMQIGPHAVGSDLVLQTDIATEMARFEAGGNLLMATTLDLNGIADALILDADADTSISAPTDDQMDFEVAGADKMHLTATGLGIGKVPAELLDMEGSSALAITAQITNTNSAGDCRLRVNNNAGSWVIIRSVGTTDAGTFFGLARAANQFIHNSGGILSVGTFSNHDLVLGTNDTERVRVDTSGNVGIATTAPGQIFDVNSGSGNMIADGYDTHSLGEYKENIEIASTGFVNKIKAFNLHRWTRVPFVSTVELVVLAVIEFEIKNVGNARLYYENLAANDPIRQWIDAKRSELQEKRRELPKYQRKHLGLVADDIDTVAAIPDVISRDDNGEIVGYSLPNHVGFLHGVIRELVDRIEVLEQ